MIRFIAVIAISRSRRLTENKLRPIQTMKPQSFPPTKKVAEFLRIDLTQAALVRALVKREIKMRELPEDKFPKTVAWVRSCYNQPSCREIRLQALNEAIDGFGVETIGDVNNYPPVIHAEYVNTGDTYSPTVVRDNATGRYILTTWGDFMERNERKLGII